MSAQGPDAPASLQFDSAWLCDLAARAAAGDRDAFGTLSAAFYDDLLAFARRRLPQQEDAEDVVQQTLFKALRGIAARDPSRPFNAWLFRIAANTVRDFYRTRKVEAELDGDAVLETEPSAEEQALWETMDGNLETAYMALTARQRWIIRLRFFDGLDYDEVAERMACSPGAARAMQMRALHAMREALEETGGDVALTA